MPADNGAFALTPTQRTHILRELGRDDAVALDFIADAEACLQAFDFAAGNRSPGDGSPAGAEPVEMLSRAIALVHTALVNLPEDVALLIDLYRLAGGAHHRIAPDVGLLTRPMQDTISAINEIHQAGGGDRPLDKTRLENRLILALANLYRRRLNRDPVSEDAPGFSRVLSLILEFAGHRLRSIAAARAATTPTRLRSVLSEINSPVPLAAEFP